MPQIQCECGESFRVYPDDAGRRVRCPACGERVLVPDEAEAAGGGSAVLWIVLGGVVLLLAVGAVVSVALLDKKDGQAPLDAVRSAAQRMQSANNLKQMGIAFHSLNDAQREISWAVYSNAPGGQRRPLHSWRVALLPYVEQEHLYRQIRLNEPWDSEHNRQFHHRMPKIYELPAKPAPPGQTYYQAFVGPGAIFEKNGRGRPLFTIKDGTSNTLLVVEAAGTVNWMEPADIEFTPGPAGFPVAGHLGNYYRGGGNVLFADGSVRLLPTTVSPQDFQALITSDGGEVVNIP